MENLSDYTEIFKTTPLAVILLIFMYLVIRILNQTNNRLINIIEQQTKILKQEKRNEND